MLASSSYADVYIYIGKYKILNQDYLPYVFGYIYNNIMVSLYNVPSPFTTALFFSFVTWMC